MHRIEIKNFGPITKVEMDIMKMTFLLGELASGKSTITKLVYFFRTAQEDFVSIISNDFENWIQCSKAYVSLLRNKFSNIFGTATYLGSFEISYYYSPDAFVILRPATDNQVQVSIDKTLMSKLEKSWNDSKSEIQNGKRNGLNKTVRRGIQNIFQDEFHSIYIPAGRALLSRQMLLRMILSREANLISDRIMDYNPLDVVDAPTRRYMVEAEDIRVWIATPKTYESDDNFLISISNKILKGTYAISKDNDFIQLPNRQLIPLSYSSSGQQEVVWLLNILQYHAYMGRKCFVIIEEPETHLHPDAQYLLIQYIAAFSNVTGSEVLIATHSPYILSSCNNLFYAEQCGRDTSVSTSVCKIIPKNCWLNADSASAYIIENSTIINIMNEKLAMIELAQLDKVASEQDDEYEALLLLMRGGKS